MARACAPTQAQRRQLADLINPPSKRGERRAPTGVMVVPVPKGWAQMTQEQKLAVWEKHASAHCAALIAASKDDTMDKPRGEL